MVVITVQSRIERQTRNMTNWDSEISETGAEVGRHMVAGVLGLVFAIVMGGFGLLISGDAMFSALVFVGGWFAGFFKIMSIMKKMNEARL